MTRLLGARYAEHNAARGRGFIYGGAARAEALRSRLPSRPGRVLDLGCRDGALVRALDGANSAATVVGVDIDPVALHEATADLLGIQANLWGPDIPVRSRVFDVVIAGEVLEHLPFPDETIGEAARVLRPDGVLVGSVPNSFRLRNRLRFVQGREFEDDPTHLRHFSIPSLEAALGVHFARVEVAPCVGRFVRVMPRLTANDLVFRASEPRPRR